MVTKQVKASTLGEDIETQLSDNNFRLHVLRLLVFLININHCTYYQKLIIGFKNYTKVLLIQLIVHN